ncbi:protein BEX2 [Octodon degus]|uniref:Protein BEX2 n=1 Tax=Octodon degus TaxID=10160 RepID=A0A6P3FNC5_OCTDE|nr:protein BEX2 [Octodon degus]XP_023559247.1 protein BEX2 [Octodon degus]
MESKQELVMKSLDTENAQQENEEKDEKELHANKGEALAVPCEADGYCVPSGNLRKFEIGQPVLHERGNLMHRLGEPQARMRKEHVGRFGEEVRQLMEKLRERQLSHSFRAVSNDPPRHEHHSDFCLMP